MSSPERKFLLQMGLAPGDNAMLTALVRDIKLTYGDRFAVGVESKFPALWRHNPHLTAMQATDAGVEPVKMKYSIPPKGGHHFVGELHRYFTSKTKLPVPLHYPKPDFHFSADEIDNPIIGGRYWIIVPGGKTDITNKFWSQTRYQEVVDRLRPYHLRFVQEGATKRLCVHPPLDNVLNMVGQTSIRDLMVNILHAEGVICGVTFQMHAAAAVDCPCVVLGGAREEPWWEDYSNDHPNSFGPKCEPVKVPHQYLHTYGIKCGAANNDATKGCWKQRVISLPDRSKHNHSLCSQPTVVEDGQTIPKCLDMITTSHVVAAVMAYYEDGYLPPPTWPLAIRNQWRREGIPHAEGRKQSGQLQAAN